MVTAALVFGLTGAFIYAARLSYYGSVDADNSFKYQSVVVATQRDCELLADKQFDRATGSEELRRYQVLLVGDLQNIDNYAESPGERAPVIKFPATRGDYDALAAELINRESLGKTRFEATVARNRRTRDFSNAMFAFAALLFAILAGRLRRALDERRSLVERLQRAFISQRRELTNIDLGSVLISATRGSNVGGDTHDVFNLDERHGMFLVADVSGKGIDAAVDTALIKYTLRTLFSEDRDPGRILGKFASLYARTATNPETFVVLFFGIVDLQTGTLRYASAGHEPAWVVLGQDVATLVPSGPIVGIDAESVYETHEIHLRPGDAVVVSTDGLTESRDARGRLLGAEGVSVWLSELSGSAQQRADSIVRRLRRRSRRITDDLAIL
ncbi:MAG: serine/threonine-protein phosphatase, partial [Candidatus Eremiobacteraeota bacterium]|nr:serine/threonine-protein phosphatase [Candidatus Eremiobacteraeota bacterium]